jgi:hypothetical protein
MEEVKSLNSQRPPAIRVPMPDPIAIHEAIFHFFGEGDRPNYASVRKVADRNPYARVRARLASKWNVEDFWDLGAGAVSFRYLLKDHPDRVSVYLSMVGPFAYVEGWTGELIGTDVDAILEGYGFMLLGHELLASRLPFWPPDPISGEVGNLWEFLFDFEVELRPKMEPAE